MNIDSIKNYPTGILVKHKNMYGLENKQKSTSANLYLDNQKVNRGYYGGSFTGLNGAAADASKGLFNKILLLCNKHTVIAQNLVALVLAAGLRPVAIMSLPGKKDKDDKIYASGHSIASGLIGFGFSSIVMYPLGKAAEKTRNKIAEVSNAIELLKMDLSELTKEQLEKIKELKKKYNVQNLKELENHEFFKKMKDTYNVKNIVDIERAKSFKNVTKILDMALDVFIFGNLKAMLTIALIPPILKYGFGLEKKKANPSPAQVNTPVDNQATMPPSMEKPEMTKFAGGLK